MSLPDTPKSRTWPFTSLEYPTPVKQRGHHVTAIGFPPTTSFTISCLLSNGIGVCPGVAVDLDAEHKLVRTVFVPRLFG